jgi:hypothetical protein
MRIDRLGLGGVTAALAIVSFFAATGVASAKIVAITISQDTFKSRCREMHGTYIDNHDGTATCKLPNGQWATCDFLIGSCTTSRIAPDLLGEAGPDRVDPTPPQQSLTSSDSGGSDAATRGSSGSPASSDSGGPDDATEGNSGSGGGKGSHAGDAGRGLGTIGDSGPVVK